MSARSRGEGRSFDRIKSPDRRILERRSGPRLNEPEADVHGRAALFSAAGDTTLSSPTEAGAGGAACSLHCSRCGQISALDVPTAVRAALPLFLFAPWREHPVFAICPACRHRTWLKIST